jgi:hypothetical protein
MPSEFPIARLAVARFGSKELQFAIRIKGGAGTPFKFWFVVECVDITETARAEYLDYPFGLCREVYSLGRLIGCGEHRGKRKSPETSSGFMQKVSPGY